MVIFCGHFPDGAEKFTREEYENESQPEWYLRQMLGSANFPYRPRNRYADISVRIRALCEKYDLPYTTGSFVRQPAPERKDGPAAYRHRPTLRVSA
jgi:hypothetical protein